MIRSALEFSRQAALIPIAFAICLVQLTVGIILSLAGLITGVLVLLGVSIQDALETSEEVMTPIAGEIWTIPIIQAVFSVGKWSEFISIAVFEYWFVSLPILVLVGANFMYELTGLKTKDSEFSVIAAGRVLVEMMISHLITIVQFMLGGAAALALLTIMASVVIGIGLFLLFASGEQTWSEALALGFQTGSGMVVNVSLGVLELLKFLPGFFERHTEFCLAILFLMGIPGLDFLERWRDFKLGKSSSFVLSGDLHSEDDPMEDDEYPS